MNLFLKNKVLQEIQKKRIEENKEHLSFFNKEESEKFRNTVFRNTEKYNGQVFVIGHITKDNKIKAESVKLFLREKGNYQTFISKNLSTGKETSLNRYSFCMLADMILSKRDNENNLTMFESPNDLLEMFNFQKRENKQELKEEKPKKIKKMKM
tara:strand:+ start:22526 stop:22987 length:462 start_codon:yes stop_codon:yes gene_type:complete